MTHGEYMNVLREQLAQHTANSGTIAKQAKRPIWIMFKDNRYPEFHSDGVAYRIIYRDKQQNLWYVNNSGRMAIAVGSYNYVSGGLHMIVDGVSTFFMGTYGAYGSVAKGIKSGRAFRGR